MSDDDSTFGSQVSKGVLWKLATFGIGFVGSVYFARTLGPKDYGIFTILIMLTNLLSNSVTGWAAACKKRLTEVDFSREEAVGSGVLVTLVVAPLISLLFVLVEGYFQLFEIREYVELFVLLFVVMCVFESLNILLTGIPKFSNAMKFDTSRTVLKFTFQFVLVLLGLRVAGMVYGLVIATVVLLPFMLRGLGAVPAVPSFQSLASISRFAVYSVPKYLVSGSYSRLDVLLIGTILTSTAVAQYQVVVKLMMPVGIVATVAGSGLMGRVSRNHSQCRSSSQQINQSLWFSSLLAVPILFGAAAMPETIISTIYGAEYHTSATVVVGIAGMKVIDTQTKQLESANAGKDRPDINVVVLVVALLLGGSLGFVFINRFGLEGIVLALLVAEFVRYVLLAFRVKKDSPDIRLLPRPLRHQLIAGAGMLLGVRLLERAVSIDSVGLLAATIALGGLGYFSILYAVSNEHRVYVERVYAGLS